MLSVQVRKRQGGFALDLAFQVEPGTTLALVGESGSGKTTALRLIAGLDQPDTGRITCNGETWYDGASGVMVPAWRRPVSYVSQDYALFPHLSVFENIAFGLRASGLAAGAVRERVARELQRFQLDQLATRKPHQVSGGQQQRTALARATALDPAVLLLDEPLSALDLMTRRSIRGQLRELLRSLECATVYVTHAPVEALVFGDRVTVLSGGQASQQGTRDDLLRHPRSAFVAEFIGLNLFQGAIVAREPNGLARLAATEGELTVVDPGDGDGEVFVSISPREITLSREPPQGSAQNVFRGPVREIVPEPPHGERVRIALGTNPPLVAEVTRAAVDALGLVEGLQVYASFKATGVVPYR